MKRYKFLSLLFIVLIGISCTDQLRKETQEMAEDVNIKTLPEYLLSGSIVNVAKLYQDNGVDNDRFNAIMLYYQQLFSTKSQTHEEFEKAPDNWSTEYGIIYDIQSGINYNNEAGRPSTAAALTVLKCFMFEYLTDIYGDIPYTDALKGREGVMRPEFDPQDKVYDGMMTDLIEAVKTLKNENDNIDKVYDLIYEGDKTKWIKFANSLRLRMLIRSYEAFGGSKKADLGKLAANLDELITSNDENAFLAYEGTAPGNSWVWGTQRDPVQSEMTRRKPSAPFVDQLKTDGDPRLMTWIAPTIYRWSTIDGGTEGIDTIYFGESNYDYYGNEYSTACFDTSTVGTALQSYPFADSLYVGAPMQGGGISFLYAISSLNKYDAYDNLTLSSYTKLFVQNSDDLLHATLLEASEVYFCLAEAAQRGWIGGDASNYYSKGIEANMQRWGIHQDDIDEYLTNNPLSGKADKLEAIMLEKWKSLFTQGHQAWFEYRRTGRPQIVKTSIPSSVKLPFPLRWRYPTVEVDNNTENVQAAVDRSLGGKDTQDAKMWLLQNSSSVD